MFSASLHHWLTANCTTDNKDLQVCRIMHVWGRVTAFVSLSQPTGPLSCRRSGTWSSRHSTAWRLLLSGLTVTDDGSVEWGLCMLEPDKCVTPKGKDWGCVGWGDVYGRQAGEKEARKMPPWLKAWLDASGQSCVHWPCLWVILESLSMARTAVSGRWISRYRSGMTMKRKAERWHEAAVLLCITGGLLNIRGGGGATHRRLGIEYIFCLNRKQAELVWQYEFVTITKAKKYGFLIN